MQVADGGGVAGQWAADLGQQAAGRVGIGDALVGGFIALPDQPTALGVLAVLQLAAATSCRTRRPWAS